MLSEKEGNRVISKSIISEEPSSIIRLRSETQCLNWRLNNNYPSVIPKFYEINGGIYPLNIKVMKFYGKTIEEGIKECNYSAYWPQHDKQYKDFSIIKDMELLHNRCLEPFYFDDPWSQFLKNKKVLVIHPFTETIKSQFKKKEKIFTNKKILPHFILKLLKPIQSSAGGETHQNNWINSLNYMINEIEKIDFDVALLGCGCYDIPISTHIKKMGKQSIIIGGGLQILFGIKGKRWDKHPIISKFYNNHWVRPADNERPKSFNQVENGCYW